MKKERQNYVKRFIETTGSEDFYKQDPSAKIQRAEHALKEFGGLWRFNEIVGFIRLYYDRGQILGQYWFHKAKKCVKTRKKIFEPSYSHKLAAEEDIPLNATNQQIYNIILLYLKNCEKEKPLLNRTLDMSTLELLGPHINWEGIITSNQW